MDQWAKMESPHNTSVDRTLITPGCVLRHRRRSLPRYAGNTTTIAEPQASPSNMHPRNARYSTPFIILAFVAVALIYEFSWNHMSGSIEYQGERFPLDGSYGGYDEFKEDPDNFNPAQAKRIQELLENAPTPDTCRTEKELARIMFDLKVPGYGLSGGGSSTSRGDVRVFSIEIPNAGKERMIVYLHSTEKNAYVRIDDFIAHEDFGIPIPDIKIAGNTIQYIRRFDGNVIRETELRD